MNKLTVILFLCLLLFSSTMAQWRKPSDDKFKDPVKLAEVFQGLKFRNIGPALMSGRIADIAIHPQNENIWYVAVGSGGVWKTENSGTTWTPIFDQQGSYSIGCITIDPNNPNVIWVGTGENIGGRHVGFGDGVYRSQDGGATWQNMGLKASEHISKIIVHPRNSDVVWVAAQGPLWSKGGERGVYKTTDGGKTWRKTLGDEEWIGATDLVIDPRNPEVLYAATWQRHRNVASYMGGGPGSGIYRSTDGGESWQKLTNGLPATTMGKIGLAISPQNPDVVYAAIELERRKGGVFRSENRGASWEKRSDAVAGGTGPHYYQEIYADPHQFDRVYLVGVYTLISDDGGKTFNRMNQNNMHVDHHAIAFKKSDPNYMLVGTDGGLYETFDRTKSWKFVANLPVTQFYKVAVDDDFPFYNIYGGTQDNNTQGGPSRTDNVHGIRNADWFITLFGDGHQPAVEPGNPDIVYSQWQQGNLVRYDRKTGEQVFIKPQPDEHEGIERFNWDAPVLISPHNPRRIYFASQRVWRSDDRGDSWQPISPDLTRSQERITLPLMDRTWGWDAQWDFVAMSDYNTITSLAESPLQEGLIYAGTDDGLIHVTEDGGKTWRKIEVGSLPGVPSTAFVNDIKADLFDPSTVYIALDNHKFGDFKPYILKSTNKGRTWTSLRANLPDRHLVWRIVQDHVKPELLFLATEFGIWFTIDGGKQWIQFKGGLPVISFRDLAIQRRENDLIGASFGRGFFILDDYSILREITPELFQKEAFLFQSRPAWWYIPRRLLGSNNKASQGDAYFTADNPPFGVVFTYYLREPYETIRSLRQKKEKELLQKNLDIPFPGWDSLELERTEDTPRLWIFLSDSAGKFVQRLEAPNTAGINRISWNLLLPPVLASRTETNDDWSPGQPLVPPGKYKAKLYSQVKGQFIPLSEEITFELKPLRKGTLKGLEPAEVAAFWKEVHQMEKSAAATSTVLRNSLRKVELMRKALSQTPVYPVELEARLIELQNELYHLDRKLHGNRSKQEIGENDTLTINDRISVAVMGTYQSTYGPTPTHRKSIEIARKQLDQVRQKLEFIRTVTIPALEKALIEAGSPWMENQPIPRED